MILKIDLDGVIYPFAEKFQMYCEMVLERPLPPPKHYSMWEDWKMTSKQFYDLLDQYVLDGHFRQGVPPDGAVESIQGLASKYDVHIVTARSAVLPTSQVKSFWQIDTIIWLHDNDIPYRGLHFTKEKMLIPGILIDDHVGNLKEAATFGHRAICFDQPWNQEWQGERVRDWGEVVKLLRGAQ